MKKRSTNQLKNVITGMILPGLLLGCIVCVIGVMLISSLISAEQIEESSAGYGVVITLVLASLVSAFVMVTRSGENRLTAAAISATGMMLMLCLGNFLAGAGPMTGFLQTLLVVIAGTACAVLMKKTTAGKKKYRNRKY